MLREVNDKKTALKELRKEVGETKWPEYRPCNSYVK